MVKYGRSPWGYHMISKAPYNASKHSSFGIVETVFLQWCGFWLTCKTQTCVQQGNMPMELYFLFCWFLFFLFLQQNTLQYLIMEQTPAMIVRLTCYHAGWHLVDLAVLCSTKPCSFLAQEVRPKLLHRKGKRECWSMSSSRSRILVRGPADFLPYGRAEPKNLPKISWKMHDFGKIFGAGGLAQKAPGSTADVSTMPGSISDVSWVEQPMGQPQPHHTNLQDN